MAQRHYYKISSHVFIKFGERAFKNKLIKRMHLVQPLVSKIIAIYNQGALDNMLEDTYIENRRTNNTKAKLSRLAVSADMHQEMTDKAWLSGVLDNPRNAAKFVELLMRFYISRKLDKLIANYEDGLAKSNG